MNCNCKTLEKIAQTKAKTNQEHTVSHRATYYRCTDCNTIIKRHETRIGINNIRTYSIKHPYRGRLTAEELMSEAQNLEGDIYLPDESEIISRRKK